MSKEKKVNNLPDGGTLPGELPGTDQLQWGREERDQGDMFMKFEAPGDTFTGVFIRRCEQGADTKYPGLLFREYPSGALKVLPSNWSIAERSRKRRTWA